MKRGIEQKKNPPSIYYPSCRVIVYPLSRRLRGRGGRSTSCCRNELRQLARRRKKMAPAATPHIFFVSNRSSHSAPPACIKRNSSIPKFPAGVRGATGKKKRGWAQYVLRLCDRADAVYSAGFPLPFFLLLLLFFSSLRVTQLQLMHISEPPVFSVALPIYFFFVGEKMCG